MQNKKKKNTFEYGSAYIGIQLAGNWGADEQFLKAGALIERKLNKDEQAAVYGDLFAVLQGGYKG